MCLAYKEEWKNTNNEIEHQGCLHDKMLGTLLKMDKRGTKINRPEDKIMIHKFFSFHLRNDTDVFNM